MEGESMDPKDCKKDFFRQRVADARKAAGFSLADAARLLEFNNYQTLSAIEKGKRNISAHELIAMARLYGRNLDYFYDFDVPPDPQPLWRKSSDGQVKSIQRIFLRFLENYSSLEHLLGLKNRWRDIRKNYTRADFRERGYKLVAKLGEEVRSWLNLGSRPATTLATVLENDLRFKVLHLPLDSGVSGACIVDDALGVGVLINANDAPWRKNFDLAHELFHAITWGVWSFNEIGRGAEKNQPDKFADAFASELLMSRNQLLATLDETASEQQIRIIDVIELAIDFGVSTEAVIWRLLNLNVLKRGSVHSLLREPRLSEKDRLKRRFLKEKKTPPKFPERYISLCCRCLMEGKISRGLFSEFLELDRMDIDRFLKAHGHLEENYEKIAAA